MYMCRPIIYLSLVLVISACDPNKVFGTRVTPPKMEQRTTVDYSLFKPRVAIAGEQIASVEVPKSVPQAWSSCIACHGASGQGGVGPALAGKSAEYLSQRLYAYKAGERVGMQSAMMWGQAGMLTDLDIEELSEWMSETL